MKQYTVVSKQRTGANTVTVQLRSADEQKAFAYKAGQYVAIGFRRGWQRTPMRCFSVTTAPDETGELGIAFRATGDFTGAMAELVPGHKVDIHGPFGDFTVSRDETRPLMFLAGGIGITPFVSMLRDLQYRRNVQRVTLLYSVKSHDIPFARELMELARKNPNYTIRFIASDEAAEKFNHPFLIKGKLSSELIRQYATVDTQYYICGPAGYSDVCHELLADLEVREDYIHNEAFSQSSKMTVAGFALQKLVYGLFVAAVLAVAGLLLAKDLVRQSEAKAALQAASGTSAAANSQTSAVSPSSTTDSSTTNNNSSSSSAPTTTYQSPRSMMS